MSPPIQKLLPPGQTSVHAEELALSLMPRGFGVGTYPPRSKLERPPPAGGGDSGRSEEICNERERTRCGMASRVGTPGPSDRPERNQRRSTRDGALFPVSAAGRTRGVRVQYDSLVSLSELASRGTGVETIPDVLGAGCPGKPSPPGEREWQGQGMPSPTVWSITTQCTLRALAILFSGARCRQDSGRPMDFIPRTHLKPRTEVCHPTF